VKQQLVRGFKSAAKERQKSGTAVKKCGKRTVNRRGWFPTVQVTEFFEPKKLRFLEKTFNSTTQRRISRRFFWLIWKISQFFRSAVNRKNALTLFLKELETSK
jgi:hypothetical protein